MRTLKFVNDAAILKLTWEMMSSNREWATLIKARFLRNNAPITHYVRSSIWPALKPHIQTVISNSTWQIGDGKHINFWTDTWLARPIVEILQLPVQLHKSLHAIVVDFIHDNAWLIPPVLVEKYPNLANAISQVSIPVFSDIDHLVWIGNDSGSLNLKQANLHLHPPKDVGPWSKLIWNSTLPPSRSFLIWRLMYNKLSANENLIRRGCITVSICNLFNQATESSNHLFLDCQFARSLWLWFNQIFFIVPLICHQLCLC